MHLSSWISPSHIITANGFTKFKKLVTHLTAGRLRNWVKCSKRMSGTVSLFPELSSAGRCKIVQSQRALPRRFSVNCRTRGKVPWWAVCAVKGKSQKRVQKYQFQKHFAGIETWPIRLPVFGQLRSVGRKVMRRRLSLSILFLCVSSVSQHKVKVFEKETKYSFICMKMKP